MKELGIDIKLSCLLPVHKLYIFFEISYDHINQRTIKCSRGLEHRISKPGGEKWSYLAEYPQIPPVIKSSAILPNASEQSILETGSDCGFLSDPVGVPGNPGYF